MPFNLVTRAIEGSRYTWSDRNEAITDGTGVPTIENARDGLLRRGRFNWLPLTDDSRDDA